MAQWLKISRTPVREAFHRIISEGLLTNGPWNGVMVADLTAKQLVDLYAVREALEGTAAALAAKNATAAEVRSLFGIAATEAAERDDPAKLVVINAKLHQVIYRAAHNQYLLQSLTTIVDTLGLLRHSTFVLPGSIALARREHLQIIHAIRDGEAKRAEMLARRHVRRASISARFASPSRMAWMICRCWRHASAMLPGSTNVKWRKPSVSTIVVSDCNRY